jgi:hypothetical protein
MKLETGKEMDRRCVLGWLNEVYRHPTVAFNTYSDEQQIEFAHDALVLLKEQEAVKPVRDEQTGRLWLCGNCGSYVGFEDHDEDDPNEFDKYCRECGRPVLWEGR